MGQMDGKVAIVTGSGRGIGQQIALRLVRDGAKVVINDIDDAPAKETVALIEKMGGKAVACNGDVAKPDFGDRIVKTAVDAFGDCHVVVNNAGYTWDSVIQKMSDEQWYAILDVHLTAPFRVLRAFQQHFRQAVEKERSEGKRIVRKVVNISSTSGVNGNAGQSNYSAGKAGIVGLTKTLAKEFGRLRRHGERRRLRLHPDPPHPAARPGRAGEIEVQGRKVKVGVQGGRIAAMNQMIPLGRGGCRKRRPGRSISSAARQRLRFSGQCLVVNGGLTLPLVASHAGQFESRRRVLWIAVVGCASRSRRPPPCWPMAATVSRLWSASPSPRVVARAAAATHRPRRARRVGTARRRVGDGCAHRRREWQDLPHQGRAVGELRRPSSQRARPRHSSRRPVRAAVRPIAPSRRHGW
jgi:3-oxoacyl-[acyl-carrier protein] reductase